MRNLCFFTTGNLFNRSWSAVFFFSIEQNFGLNIQIALTTVFPIILSSKSVFSLCCLPQRQVGMPVPQSHRNPTWVPLNFKMKSGIHIPSHPVHPDDYNLVWMIKITSKVALRMSEVLLPTTKSFQNFLYDFIHFPCVFLKVSSFIKCETLQKRKWQTWLWTNFPLIHCSFQYELLFCCKFAPSSSIILRILLN